jgi:hypothetical protein
MTAVPAPLNAAQRAHVAFEQMQQHRRDVALARSRRDRARNIRLALISTVALVAGLTLSSFLGMPIPLISPHSVAKAAKPVDRFAATNVGHIRVPYLGDICRQVAFDNRSGRFRSESLVVCDGVKQTPGGDSSTQARSRLNSLRDAFKR